MHLKTLFVLLIFGIFIPCAISQKFKRDPPLANNLWNLEQKLDILQQEESDLEAQLEEELEDLEESDSGRVDDVIDIPALSMMLQESPNEENAVEDPCQGVHCEAGRECVITVKGEGVCECVSMCENIDDERRKVCSNHNSTWPSDCELHRMRCLCVDGSDECRDKKFEHIHIDYYGSCQEVPECEEQEMKDFPRRMREWLFNIMEDMAERNELGDRYLRLKKEAEVDEKHKWVNAAVWKWCQLDTHPRDRSISRHEIFPVRAPLYTLEHCISPFLDSCDPDDDHYISLKEWTKCLELSEELTEDMEDLCEEIRE